MSHTCPLTFGSRGNYISLYLRVISTMPTRGNKGSLFILQKVSPDSDPDALWASTRLRPSKQVSTELRLQFAPLAASTSPQSSSNSRPWWAAFSPTKNSPQKPSMPKKKVCIILPAQLASATDYNELSDALKSTYGYEVIVTPLSFGDWVVSQVVHTRLVTKILKGWSTAFILDERVPPRTTRVNLCSMLRPILL